MTGTTENRDSPLTLPEPHDDPPAGFHYETFHPSRWEIGGGGRVCRMPKCRSNAVATMYRTAYYAGGNRQIPWAYCADHLYGAWIEDGEVTRWRLVRDES